MSRTFKDRPSKVCWPHERYKRERIPYIAVRTEWDGTKYEIETSYWVDTKGGPKIKKAVDVVWHWMRGHPGWYTRMVDEVPRRREASMWARDVVRYRGDLLDLDTPVDPMATRQWYW